MCGPMPIKDEDMAIWITEVRDWCDITRIPQHRVPLPVSDMATLHSPIDGHMNAYRVGHVCSGQAVRRKVK